MMLALSMVTLVPLRNQLVMLVLDPSTLSSSSRSLSSSSRRCMYCIFSFSRRSLRDSSQLPMVRLRVRVGMAGSDVRSDLGDLGDAGAAVVRLLARAGRAVRTDLGDVGPLRLLRELRLRRGDNILIFRMPVCSGLDIKSLWEHSMLSVILAVSVNQNRCRWYMGEFGGNAKEGCWFSQLVLDCCSTTVVGCWILD